MPAATLSPTEAAATRWDVIVVGAGPGGAAAALRLARAARRVLLIDRHDMPRPKVCGCCLSPRACRELQALAVRGILAAALPLERVRLVAGGREATLAMRGGATLSREALDTGLVSAVVTAGADWFPGATVRGIEDHGTGVVVDADVRAGGRVRLTAAVAIIAAGLSDAIRITTGLTNAPASNDRRVETTSRIGLGATLPAGGGSLATGELVMATARNGYVGIVRLEDGRLDVAAAVDRHALGKAGPGAAMRAILMEAGGAGIAAIDPAVLETSPVRATPALTHHTGLCPTPSGRVMRVGDAAAYVEPFTGEGIGWALASGRLAAEALTRTPHPQQAATIYRSSHGRCFRLHHARCRGLALMIRRPALVGGVVRIARIAPRVAAGLLPWIAGGGPSA